MRINSKNFLLISRAIWLKFKKITYNVKITQEFVLNFLFP